MFTKFDYTQGVLEWNSKPRRRSQLAAELFSYSPCESWIAGSTPLFFSLSDESFHPCHDLSCHDTDEIQIQRWRCSYTIDWKCVLLLLKHNLYDRFQGKNMNKFRLILLYFID